MLRQTEDGRYSLSAMEYYRLLCLQVAISEIVSSEGELWERLGKIKNGRRDMRMIESTGRSLVARLLDTVTIDKILTIRSDLEGAVMHVSINPAVQAHKGDLITIRSDDLRQMIDYVIERNCLLCDNTTRAKVKGCKIRKMIDRVMHYDCDPLPDGSCPFEGVDSVTKFDPDSE